MKNPYTKLARQTIKHYLEKKKVLKPPDDLPAEMLKKQAGVFISIHKKDDSLRGCIGTFLPTKKNIAEEIIVNALEAAFQDPRFPVIKQKELPDLEISVDLLSKLKLVKKNFRLGNPLPKILNPKKYGLMITSKDGRKGLLLPDIPGVDSAQKQIEICYQKAGIPCQKPVKLQVFEVERHKE